MPAKKELSPAERKFIVERVKNKKKSETFEDIASKIKFNFLVMIFRGFWCF